MAPAQEIDIDAMKAMTEVRMPQAKLKAGNSVAGIVSGPSGRTEPGTIPHRDIPHQEFPRVVYLHPRKPFKKMNLPVDGHGNKELQWVPNEAKTALVNTKEELAAKLKDGYQLKHYVVPALPAADPEEDATETK